MRAKPSMSVMCATSLLRGEWLEVTGLEQAER
jgi:hypothetical protein